MNLNQYFSSVVEALDNVKCTLAGKKAVSLEEARVAVVAMLRTAASDGQLVMVVGNGGSAAMAAHFAEDLVKMRSTRATSFDSAPLLTCLSNDFGFYRAYERSVKLFASGGPLVAISSSGESSNILRAARATASRQCPVVTLTGFAAGNALRAAGDVNFYVPVTEYGIVESAHAVLLHGLVDCWEEKK